MYHLYKKEDPCLRKAIYEAYNGKCLYCGRLLKPREMQVDHILARKAVRSDDREFNEYLIELRENGFDPEKPDYIENYVLCCGPCNLEKRNHNFEVSHLRYYHDTAMKKAEGILRKTEAYKTGTDVMDFREAADEPLEYLEPVLKEYLLQKFDSYQAQDEAVQTPQLLLMLLTYPHSSLQCIFNGYEMIGDCRYGDWLVAFFKQTDLKYKSMKRCYREQNWTAFLRILEKAKEVFDREKYADYITANILCYAILEFSGGTTVEMMRGQIGDERFSKLKKFILEDRIPSLPCGM